MKTHMDVAVALLLPTFILLILSGIALAWWEPFKMSPQTLPPGEKILSKKELWIYYPKKGEQMVIYIMCNDGYPQCPKGHLMTQWTWTGGRGQEPEMN